jgi:hypothetical protein
VRLISRLLVKSVKVKSNQALAARLLRAAAGVESLGTTPVRVKKTL